MNKTITDVANNLQEKDIVCDWYAFRLNWIGLDAAVFKKLLIFVCSCPDSLHFHLMP